MPCSGSLASRFKQVVKYSKEYFTKNKTLLAQTKQLAGGTHQLTVFLLPHSLTNKIQLGSDWLRVKGIPTDSQFH